MEKGEKCVNDYSTVANGIRCANDLNTKYITFASFCIDSGNARMIFMILSLKCLGSARKTQGVDDAMICAYHTSSGSQVRLAQRIFSVELTVKT